MSWWLVLVLVVVALLVGACVGALAVIRVTKWRERAWLRARCRVAAKHLQGFVGNPLILINMQRRAASGHNYLTDKQLRNGLLETLEKAFDLRRGWGG